MHGIFGERFLGRREPAWHGLGQTFDEPLMPIEAIRRIGMDYTVDKVPLSGAAFGETIQTDMFALVRQPTADSPKPAFLGTCGRGYEVIQNSDIATVIEPLAKDWPVETAGALNDGKAMFLTLDAGSAAVSNGTADEELRQYFLVTNTHDQGRSLRVAYTPMRVVCQNTLAIGLSEASLNIGLTHHRNVHEEFALTVKIVAAMRHAQQKVNRDFNRMAVRVLTAEEVGYILAASYTLPAMPQKLRIFDSLRDNKDITSQFSEQELLKLASQRKKYDTEVSCLENYKAGAVERFEAFSDEQPAFAGTAWALYNGITETENYRNGNKNVPYDILFGRRADIMTRGFQATMNVLDEKVTV